MVVFGGTSDNVIGRPSSVLTAVVDCQMDQNDVAMVFDLAGTNAVQVANLALSAIGNTVGLTGTSRQGDCLGQPQGAMLCTLGDMAPISNPNSGCPGSGTTQNEPMAFQAAFGCR
jgi:hypothetical protein